MSERFLLTQEQCDQIVEAFPKGSKLQVLKEHSVLGYPHWVSDMEEYKGKVCEVSGFAFVPLEKENPKTLFMPVVRLGLDGQWYNFNFHWIDSSPIMSVLEKNDIQEDVGLPALIGLSMVALTGLSFLSKKRSQHRVSKTKHKQFAEAKA